MEVAIATGTPVSDWLDLPTEYLLTAIDVLKRQAKAAERAQRRGH